MLFRSKRESNGYLKISQPKLAFELNECGMPYSFKVNFFFTFISNHISIWKSFSQSGELDYGSGNNSKDIETPSIDRTRSATQGRIISTNWILNISSLLFLEIWL